MRSIHEFYVNATKNIAACAGNTSATGLFYLKNAGLDLTRKVGHALCVALLGWGVAWAQDAVPSQVTEAPNIIPFDAATQGYKVNNREIRFKEHLLLPEKTIFRNKAVMDSHHVLANLIIDEQGNYEQDKINKIVIVDTQTGEIKPTPYSGTIRCFVDGKLATLVNSGKQEEAVFSYGKYGEPLQTWKGVTVPEGMFLNVMSCTLQAQDHARRLKDGTFKPGVNLRHEHGALLKLSGEAGKTANASREVQRLMAQPFMCNMALPATTERWVLKKPDGEEISIPNNPGEAIPLIRDAVSYLPYMDAYFMASMGNPMLPKEMASMPRFSRVLYPDGRVVLYGVPDVIWQAVLRGEIGFHALYTKAGLIWRIQYARIDRVGRTNYKGELEEGYYLDQPATKTLTKIPNLAATSQGGLAFPVTFFNDGCRVETREEVVQKRPHILLNTYYVNLCTGE